MYTQKVLLQQGWMDWSKEDLRQEFDGRKFKKNVWEKCISFETVVERVLFKSQETWALICWTIINSLQPQFPYL